MSFKILLTGATGYIGGAVLERLLTHNQYTVTVTVRQQEQAEKLKVKGVHTAIASLDDLAVLEGLASEADIVVDTASAFHPASAQALIAGLALRKEITGKETHYIHTGGSGIISDNAAGEFKSNTVYSDTDYLYSIEVPNVNYPVSVADVATIDAGLKLGVKTYIIAPPTVYGVGDGAFNKISKQIPILIRAALKLQQSRYVGKGLAVWSHVSISDLAALYTTLTEKALANEAPYGKSGYYFPESGEHSWKEVAEGIAKALRLKEPSAFESIQVAGDVLIGGSAFFAALAWGSNVRVRGTRGRQIGWKPTYAEDTIYGALPAEIEAVRKDL